MRAVVQKISRSQVTVDGELTGKTGPGLLVLLGVTHDDTEKDAEYMADKLVNLRIFEDENEKLNLSLIDVGGEMMAVSQFTLYGDCRKGRRPGFTEAARPEPADKLYQYFVQKVRDMGINVETGRFQTHMMVELVNDGPVTILVDSKKLF